MNCTKQDSEECFCDDCYNEQARKNEIREEAIKAYEGVSRFLNGRNGTDLVAAIARDHRTLQQAFTGACVAWFEHLASLPEGLYDGRNQAAVELAKAITATKEWQERRWLPHV